MVRYIDAEKLIEGLELSIKSWGRDCNSNAPKMVTAYKTVLEDVKRAHTADVVAVVRCKECKYSREDKELCDMYGCTLYRDMRKGSDFCNYGERKEQSYGRKNICV